MFRQQTAANAIQVVKTAIAEVGKPLQLQTDNGSQFTPRHPGQIHMGINCERPTDRFTLVPKRKNGSRRFLARLRRILRS